jgi:uncharacterized protein YuzE
MAQSKDLGELISVQYDPKGDILTFSFTREPQVAVAEEAADEIWVRYDMETHRIVTVDVLNFSSRVRGAFGPQLVYPERADPDRLEAFQPFKKIADQTSEGRKQK